MKYKLMVFEIMKKTGTENVKSVLKIGDTTSDVLEGQNAGADTVAIISTGAHCLNDFLDMSILPTYIISHVKDLKGKFQDGKIK